MERHRANTEAEARLNAEMEIRKLKEELAKLKASFMSTKEN